METAHTRQAPAAAPAVPPSVAGGTAIALIGFYAWREMARRRRLVSLLLLTMVPGALLLAVRLWYPYEVAPESLLAVLTSDVFIPFLIPIVAMAVGVTALGEPIEEGTLIYYWTRPVQRWALYLGRLFAAQIVAGGVLLLSLVICFTTLLLGGFGALSLGFVKLYLGASVVILLGTGVYTAVFACIGTGLKRPLLLSILFAFGWEPTVGQIPQRIQEWTLRFHLRNLIDWPQMPGHELRGFVDELLQRVLQRDPVPTWRSLLVMLAATVVVTVAGVWLLKRRQLDKQGG